MYMGPNVSKGLTPKLKNELNIVNSSYVKERNHINKASLISFVITWNWIQEKTFASLLLALFFDLMNCSWLWKIGANLL
jgi:hypothetical protein